MMYLYKCDTCGKLIESSNPDLKDIVCVLSVPCPGTLVLYRLPPDLPPVTRLRKGVGVWKLLCINFDVKPGLVEVVMHKPTVSQMPRIFENPDLETACAEALKWCEAN